MVLVSRYGALRDTVVRAPPFPPRVVLERPRAPRAVAAGSGDDDASFPNGEYYKVPLVDQQGRMVYVQRW